MTHPQPFFSRRSAPPSFERTTIEIPLIHFKSINAFSFEGVLMKSRDEALALLANALRLGEAVFELLAKGYMLRFVHATNLQAPPLPYHPLGRNCHTLPGDTSLTVRTHPYQADKYLGWAKLLGQNKPEDGIASAYSLFHEIRDYQNRGHYLAVQAPHHLKPNRLLVLQ